MWTKILFLYIYIYIYITCNELEQRMSKNKQFMCVNVISLKQPFGVFMSEESKKIWLYQCISWPFMYVDSTVTVDCIVKREWIEKEMLILELNISLLCLYWLLWPLNFWLDFPCIYIPQSAWTGSKLKKELMDCDWLFNWFNYHVNCSQICLCILSAVI